MAHVNAHQRVTSREEDFNNQVNSLTQSTDSSQLLPLTTPIIDNELINKVALVAGIKFIHGSETRLSLTKDHLATTSTEYLICQQQRPNRTTDMPPFPGVISQLLGGRLLNILVDYIRLLPSWKMQQFVLNGIDIYSGNGFSFLACKVLQQKLPSVDLESALSTIMVFCTALLLIRKSPHSKWIVAMSPRSWNPALLIFPST